MGVGVIGVRQHGAQLKVQRLRSTGGLVASVCLPWPFALAPFVCLDASFFSSCLHKNAAPVHANLTCFVRCRLQLKNAEEAKIHNETTGHANFEESTEAVSACRVPPSARAVALSLSRRSLLAPSCDTLHPDWLILL